MTVIDMVLFHSGWSMPNLTNTLQSTHRLPPQYTQTVAQVLLHLSDPQVVLITVTTQENGPRQEPKKYSTAWALLMMVALQKRWWKTL